MKRHFVLTAVFQADDEPAAQRRAVEVVTPLLHGDLLWWEVQETWFALPVHEEADAILEDHGRRDDHVS